MCMVLYALYVHFHVKKNPETAPLTKKSTWKERFRALPRVWDFAIIMFVIFAGIYGGWCSPTEAGAISCAIVIIVLIIKRKFTFKLLWKALLDTMKTTGTAFFVVGTAFAFSSFLTMTKLPTQLATTLASLNVPGLLIIFVIVAFFFILGMFIDIMSVVYITVPILIPVVEGMGYDLIWFAVVLLTVAVIGGITPPFGGNMFIVKACIPDSTMKEIYRGSFPYVILTLIVIVLCILFPSIVMFLPNLMS